MAVTIQQAAVNALATWLTSQLTGGVTVATRWPSPDRPLPAKAVTILLAGARTDIRLDPEILSATNLGDFQTTVVWRLMACTQPLQLDVWAQSDFERDDIMAQLDTALNAGESSLAGAYANPVGHGCLVAVADGWPASTTADFVFNSPDIDDSPESAKRSEWRGTYRGEVHVMLSVTKVSARQVSIVFKQKLHETDTAASTDKYDNTTIDIDGESHSTDP
jgi:hypothetical protein